LNFQNAFDLELSSANAACLVPVQLGTTHRTIREFNVSSSLELPPAMAAVKFPYRLLSRILLPEAIVCTSVMRPMILKNTPG